MKKRYIIIILLTFLCVSFTGCGSKGRAEITDIQPVSGNDGRQYVNITYKDGTDTQTMKYAFSKLRIGDKNEVETGYVLLVYVDQNTYDKLYNEFDEMYKKQAEKQINGGKKEESESDE